MSWFDNIMLKIQEKMSWFDNIMLKIQKKKQQRVNLINEKESKNIFAKTI